MKIKICLDSKLCQNTTLETFFLTQRRFLFQKYIETYLERFEKHKKYFLKFCLAILDQEIRFYVIKNGEKLVKISRI